MRLHDLEQVCLKLIEYWDAGCCDEDLYRCIEKIRFILNTFNGDDK